MPLSIIKDWEDLTIADNFLFQKVMQNKRICKHLIEKILHIQIKDITFPDSENTINIRYDSKSVRLDVYVEDEKGRVFDIEMQCTNGEGDELPKRTRYYQGMIDMELLEKGKMYDDLNPSYIIFICTFDPFRKGLPMYTFRNRCLEDSTLELGDQTAKLFLNSKGQSDTLDPDIAAFLRYVDGHAPEGQFAKEINQEVVRVKKHDETRREYMTCAMEIRRREQKAVEERLKETAKAMIRDGMPIDLVEKYTQLSPEAISKIVTNQQSRV